MLKFVNALILSAFLAVMSVASPAFAAAGDPPAPPDFSTLTTGIDFSTVVVAIMAVALILAGVAVASKGARTVLGFLGK